MEQIAETIPQPPLENQPFSQIPQQKGKITPAIELMKKSIDIYRQGFKKFISMFLIGLAAFIPFVLIIFIAVFLHFILKGSFIIPAIYLILGIGIVVAILAAIYISTISQIGIFIILKRELTVNFKEAWQEAKKYFWQYMLVSIILFFVVLAWSLLFFIPGIIFGVYYAFAHLSLIIEDYKSTSALKRSKELVKNYWWAVVGRGLAIYLILFIVSLVMGIPFMLLEEGTILFFIWDITTSIFSFIIAPIFFIYSYLIYKDLVDIKGKAFKNEVNPQINTRI